LPRSIFTYLFPTLLLFILSELCFVPTTTFKAFGQPASQVKDIVHLPEKLGANFRTIGKVRTLSAEQCSTLPNADIYKEFTLESLTSGRYTDGKNSITVEIFQLKFDSDAFGLFTFIRSDSPNTSFEYFDRRYVVRILSETLNSVEIDPIVQSLKEALTSSNGDPSLLPSHLPKEGKIEGSEKYLIGPAALAKVQEFADLKEVVNFSGGTEATVAKYHNGSGTFSLMIVEYHTPQLATDGESLFQNYIGRFPEQEKQLRLLKRIGNYIVITTAVQDLATAQKIVSEVKYTPVVYWEARKITDLPIAFRPPDPLAVQEVSQTANLLVRTFYWIGVMLFGAIVMGIISGGVFFYWNRYRRRKLGLDDAFSDAGGAVRLNIDGYLLPAPKTEEEKGVKD